jgi:hypothetical protein
VRAGLLVTIAYQLYLPGNGPMMLPAAKRRTF